ncbi:MAG: hypothetical protein KA715_06165 [Xanthomonadaceae bacterium]|nr:hypothetical protein [Xanthomonadaceae bacterium]
MNVKSVLKLGIALSVLAGTGVGAIYFYKSRGGVVTAQTQAVLGITEKVEKLRKIDELNERLSLENQKLRSLIEETRFECQKKAAEKEYVAHTQELKKETGTPIGRKIASIGYEIPKHLLPSQIYVLGMDYLDRHDDEKAAVIFHYLTHLEHNSDYKNANAFLLSGAAWYRVQNYVWAQESFDQAIKLAEQAHNEKARAQGRLWRALASQKMNQKEKAQAELKGLIEHHPHSKEAKWINPEER